ncbi:hypothetical protein BHE74_00029199 [Ensete ventricosum]|nr:hypothetical protein BHE74_00029199 [Ensete ventricosum]
MGMLEPIKLFDGISFKMDDSNLHHGSICDSVEPKVVLFSPCYDFFGLGGRPMLSSTKRSRILFSMRFSKASNLALIASSNAMVQASRSVMLRSFFCYRVKDMRSLEEKVAGKKDLNITDLEAYTMALEEAIDAKFEAFESCMEEKMQSLFAEFSIGRPSSPRKSHHGETSDWRDDPQEHGHITSNPNNPCMTVDFLRWEEGDPIGWISCVEHYVRFYQTVDATWVEITTIHLEGDAIKWFNWFEHTLG